MALSFMGIGVVRIDYDAKLGIGGIIVGIEEHDFDRNDKYAYILTCDSTSVK